MEISARTMTAYAGTKEARRADPSAWRQPFGQIARTDSLVRRGVSRLEAYTQAIRAAMNLSAAHETRVV